MFREVFFNYNYIRGTRCHPPLMKMWVPQPLSSVILHMVRKVLGSNIGNLRLATVGQKLGNLSKSFITVTYSKKFHL